jgi:hypothetical protein
VEGEDWVQSPAAPGSGSSASLTLWSLGSYGRALATCPGYAGTKQAR